MLFADNTTLLCPCNDLESATILGIARELGVDVRVVTGGWGLILADALVQHPDIDGFRRDVVTVELPSAEEPANAGAERLLLEQAGKRVHVIDHHDSAASAMQDAPREAYRPSSLEQFAALFGHELTREQYLVAIADRDYFPGLSAAGASWDEALALRAGERAIRGETDDFDAAQTWADGRIRTLGKDATELRFLRAPARFRNLMLDVLQTPTQEAFDAASKCRKPLRLPGALVIVHAEDEDSDDPNQLGAVLEVRYAGPASMHPALRALRDDPAFAAGLKTWSGGGRFGCFFGAEARPGYPAPPFDSLVSRVLGYVLDSAMPLREYQCSFLLPLDLFADEHLRHDPAGRKTDFHQRLQDRVTAGDIQLHKLRLVPASEWQPTDDEAMLETEARLYFLPQLQDVLFDTEPTAACGATGPRRVGLDPIQRYRLPRANLVDSLRWTLTGQGIGASALTARIADCSLYRYYNDLFILAISVTLEDRLAASKCNPPTLDQRPEIPGTAAMSCDAPDWWHPLFDIDDQGFERIARRQLDHWLRFTKHGRILYRSFIEQVLEFKVEPQRLTGTDNGHPIHRQWQYQDEQGSKGDDLSPIVYWLLQRFFAPADACAADQQQIKDRLRLQYLCEERMFVNVAYALCGETPRDQAGLEQRDRLFSLALYVDRESDGFSSQQGYVYDRAYTQALMTEGSAETPSPRLDRWRGIGTLSGYSPYANAYLGSGDMFASVIAPRHVPYHYQRMLILVLFYQLTLRGYNRRISHATTSLLEGNSAAGPAAGDPGQAFRALRGDFIEFTNNYWFREITLAIQGKEIFERQIAAAELVQEYTQIKDEMERADEYTASLRDRRLNDHVFTLSLIGLLVAALATPWTDYGIAQKDAIRLSAAAAIFLLVWVGCRLTNSRLFLCRWLKQLAKSFGSA